MHTAAPVPRAVPGAAQRDPVTLGTLEQLEAHMANLPAVAAQLRHRFGPGVYLREVEMPAGAMFLGHEHRRAHFSIVLSGRARVLVSGGEPRTIVAGDVFLSSAGTRKLVVIEEAMRFVTIHPTDETDLEKLEAALIRKSETSQAAAIVRGLNMEARA